MQREQINDQINEKSAPKWRLRPQWDSGSAAQWDAGSGKCKQKEEKIQINHRLHCLRSSAYIHMYMYLYYTWYTTCWWQLQLHYVACPAGSASGAAFAPFVFICCLCAHITQKETKNHKTNREMKTKNKTEARQGKSMCSSWIHVEHLSPLLLLLLLL